MSHLPKKKYNGICCFDVDKTLTCGKLENLKGAVNECRKRKHAVAIVTARGVPTLFPIRPRRLGFPDRFDVRYGKFWSFSEKEQARRKAQQMEDLRVKYNSQQLKQIDKKNVYLFDDKMVNINTVNTSGFTGVHVHKCNLSRDLVKQAMRDVRRASKKKKNDI